MGWFFRRSAKFGPFRLNFSKSGIGVSAGIRGARISTGPRGTYVNLGTNGVYYRQKVGGPNRARSAPQWTSSPINPTMPQLPSSLNYPTFPKHGLPRIVTTLGLLSIPLFISVLLIAAAAIDKYSSSSTGTTSNNDSRPLVGNNNGSMSSRERGFQAGFDYAQRADTVKKKLSQRRLRQLAAQMAAITKEDQDWQLGWIDGYKNGVDAVSMRSANENKSMREQATVQESVPRTLVQPPRVLNNAPTANDGYIRGPRGGCYYYSGSGRKVYVDRGLCN